VDEHDRTAVTGTRLLIMDRSGTELHVGHQSLL
jgi:hypothetical protein